MTTSEKGVRLRMRIQKSGHTYLPEELRKAGFEGDVDLLPNYFTALIVKPGATPSQILRSLRAHLEHIEMALEEIGTIQPEN